MKIVGSIVRSIARNDRFGSFFCENCQKHRAKHSFLEACSVKFRRSLARNDRFGSFFWENCIVLFGSNHTPVLTDEEWKTIPLKRCDQKDHVMKESDVWQWPSPPTAGLSGS